MAVLILSVVPVFDDSSIEEFGVDKIVHVIFYAIFTLLCCFALIREKEDPGLLRTVIISLILSVLYGGVIELVQEHLVPWRSGDRYDFLADVLGALLGSVIFNYFYAKSVKIKQNGLKEESGS